MLLNFTFTSTFHQQLCVHESRDQVSQDLIHELFYSKPFDGETEEHESKMHFELAADFWDLVLSRQTDVLSMHSGLLWSHGRCTVEWRTEQQVTSTVGGNANVGRYSERHVHESDRLVTRQRSLTTAYALQRKLIVRYDTIRDAILACARKPTRVTLIYCTETTAKKWKTEKLKSKNGYA